MLFEEDNEGSDFRERAFLRFLQKFLEVLRILLVLLFRFVGKHILIRLFIRVFVLILKCSLHSNIYFIYAQYQNHKYLSKSEAISGSSSSVLSPVILYDQ